MFDVKAGPFDISRWEYAFEPADGGTRVTESWTERRPKLMELMSRPIMGISDRAGHNRTTMEATL